MFENILNEIKRFATVIIHRHANPDGDALGSQIGLKALLRENFPEKRILAVGDDAKRYSFMDSSTMDSVSDSDYDGALAIILDTSAAALISDARYTLAERTARIDHHIFCEKIADVELTDTSFESCCGMIAAMARECGWRVTPLAAKSLYTGMITDSGRFRYDSTSAETFRLAAFLRETPFETEDIYRNLYTDDFSRIRLRAQFVLKIKFTKNGVAYIYTTKEEAEQSGADNFTLSRGMVGTMSEIRGVDLWVNFTETDGGIFCELRSSRYNVNAIAVKYGGGGHEKASGATLPDKESAMRLLSDLDALAGGEK
jgi:phosphoesterase RecJ-like protein